MSIKLLIGSRRKKNNVAGASSE